MTILELLAHEPDLLIILGEEAESLVEREVFLALVAYLSDSTFRIVLVDAALEAHAPVVSVHSAAELGKVAELGDQGVLLEAAKEAESDRLDLLIGLGGERLVVRVLDVADRCLLPELALLGLPEVVDVDLGQALLQLDKLVLLPLDLYLVRFFHDLQLLLRFILFPHNFLFHVLDLRL